LFRRLFLKRLQAAFDAKGLGFFGDLAYLADPAAFAAHLAALRRLDWIVYAKKPFGGPAQVLAYLGRYTHARKARAGLARTGQPDRRRSSALSRMRRDHEVRRRPSP
jgi:hypothetical protein